MCLDKGYDYDEVRKLLQAFGYTAHIRGRGGCLPKGLNCTPEHRLR